LEYAMAPPSSTSLNRDRNLLFGVLALQTGLLDSFQFTEACAAWAARRQATLADLLVERKWLTPIDRSLVNDLLDRAIERRGGDVRASLAAVADDAARHSLAAVANVDVQQSLGALPHRGGHVLVSTIAYVPGTRERYTLTRLHAQGGIGQVWLAHDGDLG